MIYKSKRKIYFFTACFLCALINATAIFVLPVGADSAWIGTGEPQYGGGSTTYYPFNASCKNDWSDYYRIDCTGLSWIYYAYQKGAPKVDMTFPTTRSTSYEDDGAIFTIPKTCAEIGGFWHFGINGKYYDHDSVYPVAKVGDNGRFATTYYNWDYLYGQSASPGNYTYTVGKDGWGHWATSYWDKATKDPYDKKVNTPSSKSVKQSLYYKHSVVYKATKSGKANEEVLDNYKEAYKYEHPDADVSKITGMDRRVWAFCYAPGMGGGEAKFSATSSVESGSFDKDTGKYTIKIKHNIKRTDGDEFEADNIWKTVPRVKTSSTSSGVKSSNGTWESTKKSQSKDVVTETFTGTILYGETVEICSKLDYYSYIKKGGEHKSATTGEVCKKLTRGKPSATDSISVEVYIDGNKTATTAGTYTMPQDSSGKYRIVYHDKATRDDNEGGNLVFTRKTTNTAVALTPGSTKNKDLAAKEVTTKEKGDTIIDYSPETSGTLNYGQTVKFCNKFEYKSVEIQYKDDKGKNATKAYTGVSGSRDGGCVTIKRPMKQCAISAEGGNNYSYGAMAGENIGSIGVKNHSLAGDFSWTPVNSNTLHALNYKDKNAWAMPGDEIQFKYEACAGAYYTVENNSNYNNNKIGTHYSASGWLATDAGDNPDTGVKTYNVNDSKTDGYLFRNEASKNRNSGYWNPEIATNLVSITESDPFPTWSTGAKGNSYESSGRFLSKGIYEMSGNSKTSVSVKAAISPSVSGDYDSSMQAYKICASAGGSGCALGKQDVGGMIVQRLSWNHVKISGGIVSGQITEHSATGIVHVPYNYSLEPFIKNETNGIAYLGEDKAVYPGVAVFPRKNEFVHNGETYATVTKETNINIRVYNDRTKNNIYEYNNKRRFNEKGDPMIGKKAKTEDAVSGRLKFLIPDNGYNQVGDRICVEMKIWPVDSHETKDNRAVYGAAQPDSNGAEQWALLEGGTRSKTITSCVTIAKRPTISVESSNAYSASGFTTSVYNKRFSSDSAKYIFGSWSEYGVFGRINTSDGKTFVSGAAVGYKKNANTASELNVSRNNDDNDNVATGATNKICQFSTQTFVNLVDGKCESSDAVIGVDAAKAYQDGILERYGNIKQNKIEAKTSDGKINLDLADGKDLEDYRLEKNNSGSVVAFYANGNAVLSKTPSFAADSDSNRTVVYNVDGDLTITGNINDERSSQKTSNSDLTGVVIIAKNVLINDNVGYINATIIARDNGTVNTCANYTFGSKEFDSTVCNESLIFDAPVFTGRIILNRTAGADTGSDSIKRAEVFNLNMANYLWSYSQMTHYNQAITTYSRELPTRY